jgi:hypothetical protein
MNFNKIAFLTFLLGVLALFPLNKIFAQSVTLVFNQDEFAPGASYIINATLTNTSETASLKGLAIIFPHEWSLNSPTDGSTFTGPSGCAWNDTPWDVINGEATPPQSFVTAPLVNPENYRMLVWTLEAGGSGIPPSDESPCNHEIFSFSITIPDDQEERSGELPYQVLWADGESGDVIDGTVPITIAAAPVVTELPETGYDKSNQSPYLLFGILAGAAILPITLHLLLKNSSPIF